MRKIIIIMLIIFLTGCVFTNLTNTNKKILNKYEKMLTSVSKIAYIEKFTIYGRFFNLEGYVQEEVENLSLVLKNETVEEEYNLILETSNNKTFFKTNELINQGINLEKIISGNYIFLLKEINNEEEIYYTLKNETTYPNLEYYTITTNNTNQKIIISFDNITDKDYLALSAKEINLPSNIYDVVIDAGHGGVDVGASKNGYYESNINLSYALALKDELTNLGLKVKLTREKDESIDTYGSNGRVSVPYQTKAKLMLSIHMNSSFYDIGSGGVEIYVPNHADLTFATNVAKNIVNNTNTRYSTNLSNKVTNGVYLRTLSQEDLDDIEESALKDGYTPYENATLDSTYYYIIRETGGIITTAYVDSRNKEKEWNHYYNSNHGCETYLLELGYINSNTNLNILLTEKDKYVASIAESVSEYLEI